jgi:hypothetical protein
MDGWMDGWMDRWMDGWMDGWIILCPTQELFTDMETSPFVG